MNELAVVVFSLCSYRGVIDFTDCEVFWLTDWVDVLHTTLTTV